MKDLLEEKCGVIADKDKFELVCKKYRIPFDIEGGNCCRLWIVNRNGAYYGSVSWFLRAEKYSKQIIFQSIQALELYLFNYLLINSSKMVVYKSDYKTYAKTITLLKKLGITGIRDKKYFENVDGFYIAHNQLKSLTEFDIKNVCAFCNGVQFKAVEFLEKLQEFIKNKNEYITHISNYSEESNESKTIKK